MGSTEFALLWKIGIPLALKLWNNGEDEKDVVKAVVAVIENPPDITEALLKADKEQTDGIVEGLFGVLTGAVDAVGGLLGAIGKLFK